MTAGLRGARRDFEREREREREGRGRGVGGGGEGEDQELVVFLKSVGSSLRTS